MLVETYLRCFRLNNGFEFWWCYTREILRVTNSSDQGRLWLFHDGGPYHDRDLCHEKIKLQTSCGYKSSHLTITWAIRTSDFVKRIPITMFYIYIPYAQYIHIIYIYIIYNIYNIIYINIYIIWLYNIYLEIFTSIGLQSWQKKTNNKRIKII